MSEVFHLYDIEVGEGEPLVLLHGNGEDSSYFSKQMEFFSHHYHVYALDTRGHGRSPRGDAPFTLGQFAEDLYGFLQEKGIRKANLLGFSDGANIAMLFALAHPEAVGKLILNGGNMYPSGVKAYVQIPIVLGYGLVSLLSLFDKKAVPHKEMLGLMVKEPKLTEEEMARITAPTLVVAGTRDMIRASHTRKLASLLPHATLSFVEGSHFCANENSEEFNKVVFSFLSPGAL